MTAPQMPFRWNGESFEPLATWRKAADREFAIGQVYRLEEVQERSAKSHNHEFAFLADAWLQLPEKFADQFPSETHLRKRALIDAGFYNETIIDCGSKAGALRVAAFARSKDEFAVVVTRGMVVIVREAKSQSRRAMAPEEFKRSKDAILEIVAGMIGVAPEALTREAGRAA